MNGILQDELLRFGSRPYLLLLTLLLAARGLDFLSTYIATPNLLLEGNPLARRLGWRWGVVVNLALCLLLACWPVPAIVLITTSVLVAGRNFQSAWLMRSLGEEGYRAWYVARVQETRPALYLACLLGQTGLVAAVGLAVMLFSSNRVVPTAIGMGIVAYAAAVLGFTVLALWRLRRMTRYLENHDPPLAGR